MVPKHFFLLLIIFSFTFAEDLDQYYNVPTEDNNGDNNLEENDCICAVNPKECNYHCCCDDNCPDEAIEDWENHSKCINEQNTPKLSDDKCIDRNLFPSWYKISKEYPVRGLHLENQTEDIPKKSATINNLCFSIDNSKSKDIITLDDLEKHGYKSIDKLYDDIFDLYIEPYFIKNNNDNSDSQSGTATTLRRTSTDDENKDPKISIDNNDNKFVKASNGKNYFSLYSGTNCENIDFVENWSPKNYSCLMKKSNNNNLIMGDYFSNPIKIKNRECENNEIYLVENKMISKYEGSLSGLYVLQVEFILVNNRFNSDFDFCKINLVVCSNSEFSDTTTSFTFKNSVIFSNNDKEPYVPYSYSGNIGYLNGYPLKIYFQGKVYNDFYIVGRQINGDCRTNGNILDYLYYSDKPLLFNEDYTYSCKLTKNEDVTSTTLYEKINKIEKIAKYGSSDYKNVNTDDWIDVTNNLKNIVAVKNLIITMKIYYGTIKNEGFYSHRYIYKATIDIEEGNDCSSDNGNKCDIRLQIKFFGDDESNESKYSKVPDIPFFIPDIPDDILDPLISPDVDK